MNNQNATELFIAKPTEGTVIGVRAYADNQNLVNVRIADGVTEIGAKAFCRCCSLTSVVIPDSVTNIGNSAFRSCSGLTSLSLPGRFRGNTSSMGIPDGCTVTFRN